MVGFKVMNFQIPAIESYTGRKDSSPPYYIKRYETLMIYFELHVFLFIPRFQCGIYYIVVHIYNITVLYEYTKFFHPAMNYAYQNKTNYVP